ncbi:MAG: hypothetical protein DRJ13_08630 [Bacteroidetes bacterium]|nr:MAG: hypothetical protein DRJ13_08630 [Bacteroidota bacterium]
MDFDIGNIFYIVITLVAVIIGVLGKKKKPAKGGSGAPEGSARPGFLENLERVLQMGQEPAEITELQEFEADLPVEETVAAEAVDGPFLDVRNRPSIMDEYDRIMNRGKDGELDFMTEEGEQINENMELLELDEIPGTNYFEIVKDFDAGTAVVYSTIINRLDY